MKKIAEMAPDDKRDVKAKAKNFQKLDRLSNDAIRARERERERAERKLTQEYKDDLQNKRDRYSDQRLNETGESVRGYLKIDVTAPDGGEQERKQRNRKACAKRYENAQASLTDEERFAILQKNWTRKQVKLNRLDKEIEDGLTRRQVDFELNGLPNRNRSYAKNLTFGNF